MSVINNKHGICPKCGWSDLDYMDHLYYSDLMELGYRCVDCGFMGKEIYKFKFHIDPEKQSILLPTKTINKKGIKK